MKNRQLMWSLYQNAKLWSTRPSVMCEIEGSYYSYCFDEAVAAWGNYVVSELEQVTGKTDTEVTRKRRNKLLQLLDAPAAQRFRAPRRPAGMDSVTTKKR